MKICIKFHLFYNVPNLRYRPPTPNIKPFAADYKINQARLKKKISPTLLRITQA